MEFDQEILLDLVKEKMPFGKFKGTVLCDIPDYYIEWFYQKGFPKGRLGMQLHTLFEIKINGLSHIFKELKKLNKLK